MRKVNKLVYLIIILLLTLFTSSDCYKSRYEYFIVQVDSLYAPSSISHNDTLNIYLNGFIGPDSCYSFSHFEAERDSFGLNLTVWGKSYNCPAIYPMNVFVHVVVSLDTIYSVYPLYPGLFYIEINQYDGSVLKDTVIVE